MWGRVTPLIVSAVIALITAPVAVKNTRLCKMTKEIKISVGLVIASGVAAVIAFSILFGVIDI